MKKYLLAAAIIASLNCMGQYKVGKISVGKSIPCKWDTIKGILYRAVKYGSYSIETGYYIAKCGGLQIGNIPVMGQEEAPIWIPGRFLRNDEVDKNGHLIYYDFHEQLNVGYFTDENFILVDCTSVYGLLYNRK